MSSPSKQPPVIIVGAGRSGTNMLRDTLVQLPGFATWPCDEINYIWRHGNRAFRTDQFTRAMATSAVQSYIRGQFDRLARTYQCNVVVEKTCANSLRCGFVDQVLPDARFIHIIRDARDVSVSAGERWTASLDLNYIWKKAKYVPPTDVPYYALRYFTNRVRRFISKDRRLSVWGPKFDGMTEAFTQNPLEVACAIQWQACVQSAISQLGELAPDRVHQVRYEDFTARPVEQLIRIGEFLEVPISRDIADQLVGKVTSKSVGRWRDKLPTEIVDSINSIVAPTLSKLGYSL